MEERVYLSYISTSRTIVEGCWGRSSMQETGGRDRHRDHGWRLITGCSLWLAQPIWRWNCSQWARSCHINLQQSTLQIWLQVYLIETDPQLRLALPRTPVLLNDKINQHKASTSTLANNILVEDLVPPLVKAYRPFLSVSLFVKWNI